MTRSRENRKKFAAAVAVLVLAVAIVAILSGIRYAEARPEKDPAENPQTTVEEMVDMGEQDPAADVPGKEGTENGKDREIAAGETTGSNSPNTEDKVKADVDGIHAVPANAHTSQAAKASTVVAADIASVAGAMVQETQVAEGGTATVTGTTGIPAGSVSGDMPGSNGDSGNGSAGQGTVDTHSHDFQVVEVKAPTCREPGYIKSQCTICGEILLDQSYSGSSHKIEVEQSGPTCVKDGYVKSVCTVCGEVIDVKTLPATGLHSYQVMDESAPTCVADGYVRSRCTVCGDIRIETLGKDPAMHASLSYADGKLYCSACGAHL